MREDSFARGCGCGCGCEGGHEGVHCEPGGEGVATVPGGGEMNLLIGGGIWMLVSGGTVVARAKPRWLPVWAAALVTWFVLCKYLICTRCEYHGEACDFYKLGKLAARMFERQPEKTLGIAGIIAEGATVAILQFMPVLAALRRPRLLALFVPALLLNQGTQLAVCCRRCVAKSTDNWKAETCPSYKMAARLWGPGTR